MEIKLDFVPDLIVFFERRKNKNHIHLHVEKMWGDILLYEHIKEYINSKITEKEDCLFMVQKGTLRCQIIKVKVPQFSVFQV